MKDKNPPLIIMLAGPNGAGKSTFNEEYLAKLSLPFINADRIAKSELSDMSSEEVGYRAAKIADNRRQKMVTSRRSFIFETVFSDPFGAKVDFLRDAQISGYHISVHFVGLWPPSLTIARVLTRVEEGGHSVPIKKILPRYERSLKNLAALVPFVDELTFYDNSWASEPHRKFACFEKGELLFQQSPIPEWAKSLIS